MYVYEGRIQMMKKLLLSTLIVLVLATGCGKVPKLENGQEAVVTLKNGDISVVLLKDYTESSRIEPSAAMTINLGGHTLTIENDELVCRAAGQTQWGKEWVG